MYSNVSYKFSKLSVCYALLTLWSIYGFASLLDNTMQWGCIVNDNLFSFANIGYSLLSVSMLLSSFYHRATSLGKWLVILEAAIWFCKLFFIKGGYVVGIAGSFSNEVMLFDTIALFLRLMLLKQLFKLTVHWVLNLVLTTLLMTLKVEYFP